MGVIFAMCNRVKAWSTFWFIIQKSCHQNEDLSSGCRVIESTQFRQFLTEWNTKLIEFNGHSLTLLPTMAMLTHSLKEATYNYWVFFVHNPLKWRWQILCCQWILLHWTFHIIFNKTRAVINIKLNQKGYKAGYQREI